MPLIALKGSIFNSSSLVVTLLPILPVEVIIVTLLTELIEGKASPLKPIVLILNN